MTQMWDLFAIYNSKTWIAIFGAFIVYIFFGITINFLEHRFIARTHRKPLHVSAKVLSESQNKNDNASFQFVYQMIRLQLGQGESLLFASRSGNFALLTFLVMQCLLLISLFTSGIITLVVTENHNEQPFEPTDLTKMLLSGRYFMVSDAPNEVCTFAKNLFCPRIATFSSFLSN